MWCENSNEACSFITIPVTETIRSNVKDICHLVVEENSN